MCVTMKTKSILAVVDWGAFAAFAAGNIGIGYIDVGGNPPDFTIVGDAYSNVVRPVGSSILDFRFKGAITVSTFYLKCT